VAAAGAIDVLANNCGILDPRPFEQTNDDQWQHFFVVQVMSGVRLSRAAAGDEVARLGPHRLHFQQIRHLPAGRHSALRQD
jgi:NAD(P)-dependent dehydrogenase (short-subunit alcohol dehydrogenase family)